MSMLLSSFGISTSLTRWDRNSRELCWITVEMRIYFDTWPTSPCRLKTWLTHRKSSHRFHLTFFIHQIFLPTCFWSIMITINVLIACKKYKEAFVCIISTDMLFCLTNYFVAWPWAGWAPDDCSNAREMRVNERAAGRHLAQGRSTNVKLNIKWNIEHREHQLRFVFLYFVEKHPRMSSIVIRKLFSTVRSGAIFAAQKTFLLI